MANKNKSQNINKPADDVVNTNPDATEVTSPVTTDKTPVVNQDVTGVTENTETPVVNPDDKPADTPVTDGNNTPVVNPDNKGDEAPVPPVVNPDDKPADTPVTDGNNTPVVNPDNTPKPGNEDDEAETKLNLFRRFDIRYASSVDKGVYITRKNWSTSDLVNTFVKMPTSFIAFESKEDLEEFKKIIAVKEINVLDKDGKKVPFSKSAKEHLVSRLSELSDMWISKKLK